MFAGYAQQTICVCAATGSFSLLHVVCFYNVYMDDWKCVDNESLNIILTYATDLFHCENWRKLGTPSELGIIKNMTQSQSWNELVLVQKSKPRNYFMWILKWT